jgi:hypothetical protein
VQKFVSEHRTINCCTLVQWEKESNKIIIIIIIIINRSIESAQVLTYTIYPVSLVNVH